MKERLVAAPLILSVQRASARTIQECMKLTIANTAQVVQTVLEGSAELGGGGRNEDNFLLQGSGRRR